ncbi:hypothetical protein [Mucilaginibacter sp. NFX135]|uniref:hypothetical protein n=1 Tax=Mucilaginibacter sp. NFX135 TaxID=3402687 RepID=UPI003AFA3B7F
MIRSNENSIIYELKPNNTRATQLGMKQLEIYMKELQTLPEFEGIKWNTVLQTY